MNIIQAIEIKTKSKAENTDYGLYSVVDEYSEFRFSECALSGTTKTYKDGFILKNGIGNTSHKIDLLESGNTVQSQDITIRLKNTSQLNFYMDSNSISLYDCEVKIIEFVGTDADADSIAERVVAVRTIEQVLWSDTGLTLKVKMSFTANRNKMISARLDSVNYPYVPEENKDKLIPVIFGSSDPANGRFFKILQSNAKEIKYYSEDWFVDADPPYPDALRNLYCNSKGAYRFPQTLTETLSNSAHLLGTKFDEGAEIYARDGSWFVGKFLKCIAGKQENQNVIRKIKSASVSWFVMSATLQDYMEALAVGNSSFSATDQTHFELYDLEFKYLLSYYAILGFYDSLLLAEATSQPEIYAVVNDVVLRVMSSSVDINLIDNLIDLNPRIYNGEKLTTLLNYEIVKPELVDLMPYYEFAPGSSLEYRISIDGTSPTEYLEGLYTVGGATTPTAPVETNKGNEIDGYKDTSWTYVTDYIDTSQPRTYFFALKVKQPELSTNITFDKCYLGFNGMFEMGLDAGKKINKVTVTLKRYLTKTEVLYEKNCTSADDPAVKIDNIPDFYYVTDPDTSNKNFFYHSEDVVTIDSVSVMQITGHKKIELPISTIEEFNAIEHIAIVYTTDSNCYITGGCGLTLNEVCFIFEKEQNIENEFFV